MCNSTQELALQDYVDYGYTVNWNKTRMFRITTQEVTLLEKCIIK